jgi:hypothetical protein
MIGDFAGDETSLAVDISVTGKKNSENVARKID